MSWNIAIVQVNRLFLNNNSSSFQFYSITVLIKSNYYTFTGDFWLRIVNLRFKSWIQKFKSLVDKCVFTWKRIFFPSKCPQSHFSFEFRFSFSFSQVIRPDMKQTERKPKKSSLVCLTFKTQHTFRQLKEIILFTIYTYIIGLYFEFSHSAQSKNNDFSSSYWNFNFSSTNIRPVTFKINLKAFSKP